MKKTIFFSLMLSALCASSSANAAEAYDACKVMMAKLAVQYEIETLPQTVKHQAFPQTGIVETAEHLVVRSYGLTKDELDKQWPRFWQFSVLAFIDATKILPRPERFQEAAFLACVREFG